MSREVGYLILFLVALHLLVGCDTITYYDVEINIYEPCPKELEWCIWDEGDNKWQGLPTGSRIEVDE